MRYRCYNCKDLRPGRYGEFKEFEADRPLCPHCGATTPAVVRLVDVHFMIADRMGNHPGVNGLRFRVGCQPKREYLAASEQDDFSATGDPTAVTCPSCMGLPEYRALARQMLELRPLIDPDSGCCG